MAIMKFALAFLTFFVLVEVYNARHLHDLSGKESWPLSQVAVIQMVIGEEKLPLLQSTPLSSSYEHAPYRRVSVPPPTPKGQATYSRVPMPPQSPPRKPPPQVQLTYIRVNPPGSSPPDDGPSPDIQRSYLEDKPNLNNESYSVAIEEPKVSPKQDSSMGQSKYGRDDPTKPPSPDPSDSQGHGMLGRVNPSVPAATKSEDPTNPSDDGSACNGFSAVAIDI
ncbi:hypothetical protein M8C21_007822 [Ambrosia artemisiifolia]|uniref:Uncharacterized protein n=1 Tax=Ambrosia artemisiifolia TaxID=4212 RepID=A0AAD5BWH9_AMBAR|nr:hypothetical protein M8C21_007822 [Ambrosia artemisiifolia]